MISLENKTASKIKLHEIYLIAIITSKENYAGQKPFVTF